MSTAVEVRERTDGDWAVRWKDPGHVPCACSPKCKAETERGPRMIEQNAPFFETPDAALNWARQSFPAAGEIPVYAR